MARKRRNKPVFYEAMGAIPLLPGAMPLAPTLPVVEPRISETPSGWLNDNRLITDAQAAAHDAWVVARGIGRRIIGRPARIMYVLAATAVVATGTITAVNLGMQTMRQYGPSLSSPAIIMNTKKTGTTILDRNGEVLYQGYGAVDRQNITLDEMPPSLKQATLSAEDPSFYQHDGFSVRGTVRAAYQDLVHNGKVQGGSTITQQLVKNTLLTDEKSFTRKYKEVLLSTELERRYSKDQILEMYLNTIYYGQGSYGVQSASEAYFHKSAKDLTPEESALLAGLPQSPSMYDPTINLKAATQRRNFVLEKMQTHGYLSETAEKTAEVTPVTADSRHITIKAPHFVFYVLDQLRAQYGNDAVEKGGITVTTTLDYGKQQKAEEIVRDQVAKLVSHHSTNGGLVSVDPHNGDIISMVGSVGYSEPGFGAVNVTLAQLQPGSSFKPIAYAEAFTKGYNGATQVDDKPINLPDGSGQIYSPQNYDLKFRGEVLLRRALANSLNIPAIEVLQHAGIAETIDMAHNLGIQSPSLTEPSRYGLSLVLGGGEVRPIDMAAVYATFANQGKSVTPRAIVKVTDRSGTDITKAAPKTEHQALDPRIAYMITNILSDTKARQEDFGVHNPLELSRPAAAKTGTTNDFRDNWTVGYTPDLATAVWVGNNDHSAMVNVDGITGAAPIWHDYMEMATANTPVHDFTTPAGVVFAKICSSDGGLASENDPNAINEVFLEGTAPTKPCGSIHPKAAVQPNDAKKDDQPKAEEAQTQPVNNPNAPGMGDGSGNNPGTPSSPGQGNGTPDTTPTTPPRRNGGPATQ